MAKKPVYISIEGGDGSGKTTLIKNLYDFLISKKHEVLLTKEFGSELDSACSELRKLALNSTLNLDETAGQLIFAAIIKQHQEKILKPAVTNSHYDIILSDRGIDSNFAYAPAHGLPKKTIDKIFSIAYDSSAILPNITFYLDIDPLLASYRRTQREAEKFTNNGVDRVEKKGLKLQEKVRQNFLKLASKNENRIVVIEVTPDKDANMILKEVIGHLKNKHIV